MSNKYLSLFMRFGGALLVVALQIEVAWLKVYVREQLIFQVKSEFLPLACLTIAMGVASGVILSYCLFDDTSRRMPIYQVLLLGSIPAFVVFARFGMFFGKNYLFGLVHSAIVRTWIFGAAIPPMWLGLIVGRVLIDLLHSWKSKQGIPSVNG